jgi:hypothetical protein
MIFENEVDNVQNEQLESEICTSKDDSSGVISLRKFSETPTNLINLTNPR